MLKIFTERRKRDSHDRSRRDTPSFGATTSPRVGNKDDEPFQISVEDRQREIAERHERSRRLLDEVFDEVCGDKAGALHAHD